jgi:hypothetical protein
MALAESDAIAIARNYIEQTVHLHCESLDEISLENPIAYFSDTDRSNYYPNSRAMWLISFLYFPHMDGWDTTWHGRIQICVDAISGEVWRYTTPKKPSSQQKRVARKERRAAKKNRNIES